MRKEQKRKKPVAAVASDADAARDARDAKLAKAWVAAHALDKKLLLKCLSAISRDPHFGTQDKEIGRTILGRAERYLWAGDPVCPGWSTGSYDGDK